MKGYFEDPEFKAYLTGLFILSLIVITFLHFDDAYDGFYQAVMRGLFQVVSIMTTTGYGTHDFDQWTNFGRGVLFLLMFFGGCAGATAGGMKISRMLVFMKTVRHEVVRAFRPNQVFRMSVNGNAFDVLAGRG